jgi:hypothetical protein
LKRQYILSDRSTEHRVDRPLACLSTPLTLSGSTAPVKDIYSLAELKCAGTVCVIRITILMKNVSVKCEKIFVCVPDFVVLQKRPEHFFVWR